MIRIKLELDKRGKLLFRANVSKDFSENIIIKRSLFESKILKSNKKYPYIIPMKFLLPLINNLGKDKVHLDEESLIEFLEFADEYDEIFYYAVKANIKYMTKWREEGCPPIYKITINKDTLEVNKNIVFERLI